MAKKRVIVRDLNILMSQQGLINLNTRSVASKKRYKRARKQKELRRELNSY